MAYRGSGPAPTAAPAALVVALGFIVGQDPLLQLLERLPRRDEDDGAVGSDPAAIPTFRLRSTSLLQEQAPDPSDRQSNDRG